jgi:uncharacterized membrane protein YozB (DUF420 family)
MTEAWIWTIIAAIGAVFSIFNIIEAHRDLRAVKERNRSEVRPARLILARSALADEFLRLFTQASFMLAGIVTIGRFTSLYLLVLWGLMAGSGAIALNAIRCPYVRRSLARAMKREAPAPN